MGRNKKSGGGKKRRASKRRRAGNAHFNLHTTNSLDYEEAFRDMHHICVINEHGIEKFKGAAD